MVMSNHFSSKDLVHHCIETTETTILIRWMVPIRFQVSWFSRKNHVATRCSGSLRHEFSEVYALPPIIMVQWTTDPIFKRNKSWKGPWLPTSMTMAGRVTRAQGCLVKFGYNSSNSCSICIRIYRYTFNSDQSVLNGSLLQQPFFHRKIWGSHHPIETTNKK